jgi:hypothetical protein
MPNNKKKKLPPKRNGLKTEGSGKKKAGAKAKASSNGKVKKDREKGSNHGNMTSFIVDHFKTYQTHDSCVKAMKRVFKDKDEDDLSKRVSRITGGIYNETLEAHADKTYSEKEQGEELLIRIK